LEKFLETLATLESSDVNERHQKSVAARKQREKSKIALVRRGAPIYISWLQAGKPELNVFTRKFSVSDNRALSFVMNEIDDVENLAKDGKDLVLEFKAQKGIIKESL
jgi:hypothetical protein